MLVEIMSDFFDKFPWKKDERLFGEAKDFMKKKQYENWVIFRFACKVSQMEDIDIVFRGKGTDAILIKHENGEIVKAFNIEFEEHSSNFKVHKHDPSKCDLIVCAYDDWKKKYPNEKCPVPVLVV